jgi:hypothetical protein
MELRKRSVLMMAGPSVVAFLIGAILTSGPLLNTTNQFSEAMGATGYVTVSIVRDGNEIYHYEDHNVITETGVDFIVDQISDSPSATPVARYIALSTTGTSGGGSVAVDDDNTSLAGEITTGGLERALGTFGGYTAATADNDDSYTVSATFTAGATHTAVQRAGLFTASSAGTMVAENTFSSVNLASGDQLTITWTIDLGLTLT